MPSIQYILYNTVMRPVGNMSYFAVVPSMGFGVRQIWVGLHVVTLCPQNSSHMELYVVPKSTGLASLLSLFPLQDGSFSSHFLLTPVLPGFLQDFPDPQNPQPPSMYTYGQCADIAFFPLTLILASILGFSMC